MDTEFLDRFGYYVVCGKKYYNKLEAFKVAFSQGYHPHWYFHEDVFDSVDWLIEPSESLPDLYRDRAHQLREKYDYLVLCFSGGSDSSNIADAFIDNDIKLDYFFNRTVLDGFDRRDGSRDEGNLHNETVFSSYPQFLSFKEKQPWLEWLVWDYGKWIIDAWRDDPITDPYQTNAYMPNVLMKRSFNKILPKLEGKKVAFIVGIDKPMIFFKDGGFFLSFLDEQIIQQISDINFHASNNINIEPFYWSKDCPKLIAKQAHTLKRFFKSNRSYMKHISHWPKRCDPDLYRQITLQTIYNQKKLELWQPSKSSYKWIYTSEKWFYNASEEKAFANWKNLYRSFEEEAKRIFERDDSALWVKNNDIDFYQEKVFNGLPGCYSKPYDIGG